MADADHEYEQHVVSNFVHYPVISDTNAMADFTTGALERNEILRCAPKKIA